MIELITHPSLEGLSDLLLQSHISTEKKGNINSCHTEKFKIIYLKGQNWKGILLLICKGKCSSCPNTFFREIREVSMHIFVLTLKYFIPLAQDDFFLQNTQGIKNKINQIIIILKSNTSNQPPTGSNTLHKAGKNGNKLLAVNQTGLKMTDHSLEG